VDNIIPHEARPGDRAFTRYFVKPVDGFIAMSQSVFEQISLFSDRPKRLSPHPIFDNFGQLATREEAHQKLGLDPTYKYLLFFGLIREYKGLDLLLEAFADARFRGTNIKLIVAGEFYTDRGPYDRLIEKHQLSADIIQVDRFIQDSEVADYFNAADLLVLPYKTATQSGVTQIAYHFNTPMIVTDVGGLAEGCPDGKVGYVVAPKPDAITNAILRFFAEDNPIDFVAGIKEEKKKYSWEILTQNILGLRDQVLSNAQPNFPVD
ncbi:MAG: glycosyltransferase, partial [Bacteroidota bacterium]